MRGRDPLSFMDAVKAGVVTLVIITIVLKVVVDTLLPLVPGLIVLACLIGLFSLVIGRSWH